MLVFSWVQVAAIEFSVLLYGLTALVVSLFRKWEVGECSLPKKVIFMVLYLDNYICIHISSLKFNVLRKVVHLHRAQ